MENKSSIDALVASDDPVILKGIIRQLFESNQQLSIQLAKIQHQLDQLLKRLYGPRSEKSNLSGPGLFDHLEQPNPETPPTPESVVLPEPVRPPRKAGHGRKKLASHLPRKRVDHDLTESEKLCPCCSVPRINIGEVITEQLEFIPASLFVLEHHRPKYVCRACECLKSEDRTLKSLDNKNDISTTYITTPMPPQVLDKSIFAPGLLAHIITSKYADHLPMYRQEGIFARFGVTMARSTLVDSAANAATCLEKIHERMKQRILSSKVIHTDDTPVPVQDDSLNKTKTGRLWVYIGDLNNRFAYFHYTPTRSSAGPQQILEYYQGYLQADAYSVYESFYNSGSVLEVACWAHARRKFDEAKQSHSALAHTALAYIAQLYKIESDLKEKSDSERQQSRMLLSVPILNQFQVWLTEQKQQVTPKSPIAEAIHYCLSNYKSFTRYTEQGYLNIDNNLSERTLRLVAIGRKNWLFCGSDEGGKTASILFSFTATCKMLKIDPFVYLRDLFTELPKLYNPTPEQLDFWLPDQWQLRQQSQ